MPIVALSINVSLMLSTYMSRETLLYVTTLQEWFITKIFIDLNFLKDSTKEQFHSFHIAYPLELKGVVVGQGDSYEEALADVKSAIRFHIDTFGNDVLELEPPVLEAFIAETGINV